MTQTPLAKDGPMTTRSKWRTAEFVSLGFFSALDFSVTGLLASRRRSGSTSSAHSPPCVVPNTGRRSPTASSRTLPRSSRLRRHPCGSSARANWLALPSMIGVWIFVMCLYFFARTRVNTPFAMLAMLFPLTTGAMPYAAESRPYGICSDSRGLPGFSGKERLRESVAGFSLRPISRPGRRAVNPFLRRAPVDSTRCGFLDTTHPHATS